jgi:hypothetical protein
MQKLAAMTAVGLIGFATGAAAAPEADFGIFLENQLRAHSSQLFGITGPLESSSFKSVSAQTAQADPTSLATLAKSLSVRGSPPTRTLGEHRHDGPLANRRRADALDRVQRRGHG